MSRDSENLLWRRVRNHFGHLRDELNLSLDWERIENSAGTGTPDVSVTFRRHGWIELKSWPWRFRPAQLNWLETRAECSDRGVYVLVQFWTDPGNWSPPITCPMNIVNSCKTVGKEYGPLGAAQRAQMFAAWTPRDWDRPITWGRELGPVLDDLLCDLGGELVAK